MLSKLKAHRTKTKNQRPLSLQKYSVCVTNGNPFHASSFFTDKPDESNEGKNICTMNKAKHLERQIFRK